MNLFRTALYTVILAFGPWAAHAQNTACKAKVPGNRHHTVKVEQLAILASSWTGPEGLAIRMADDSVWVKNGDTPVAAFLRTERGYIAGPLLTQYEGGHLKRVDSLRTDENGHREDFFGNFVARVAYTRTYHPNGAVESIHHYRRDGYDSLLLKRYPQGTPRQTVWYYTRSYFRDVDSATFTYYPTGILQREEKERELREYSPEGILQYTKGDTMIDSIPVIRYAHYYAGGTLRSTEYFLDGTPCHTWLYYTEQGTLAKTEPHTRVRDVSTAWGVGVVEATDPMVFTMVEQGPEFAGGRSGLERYLHNKLCESPVRLQRGYTIYFSVLADGRARFGYAEGRQPKSVHEVLVWFIDDMPRWRPGKMNGRGVEVAYRLRISIQ